MEVQKSKEDTEDISDYYIKRRMIDTDKSHHLQIKSMGLTDDGNVAVKSQIQDENIVIILDKLSKDVKSQMDINYFFNNIFSYDTRYDENQIIGEEFKAYISDDLTELGIRQNEYMYDIQVVDDDFTLNEIPDDFFDGVFIWNSYTNNKVNKSPWVHKITNIKSYSKNKFDLEIEPIDNYKITWELDIPFQMDIESHPLAKLIEDEGLGDPKNLEDVGEVVVMHKSDVPAEFEIIGIDKTEEWVLLSKKQYEYIDYTSMPSLMSVVHSILDTFFLSLFTIIGAMHVYSIIINDIELSHIPIFLLYVLLIGVTIISIDISSGKIQEKLRENVIYKYIT